MDKKNFTIGLLAAVLLVSIFFNVRAFSTQQSIVWRKIDTYEVGDGPHSHKFDVMRHINGKDVKFVEVAE